MRGIWTNESNLSCVTRFATAMGLFLSSAFCAQAQDNLDTDVLLEKSLEELMEIEVPTVYAASKQEEKTIDAPGAVSIVTADEIKKFGYRSLTEVLDSMRGYYSSNDRNYSYSGLRGFNRPGDYDTRILVLIDGHRLNEAVYNSSDTASWFPVDVDLIEKIELIRGPGSSLYGSNAFFGVINVVTKKGGDYDGAEVSASGGAFDTYGGRVTAGRKFEEKGEVLVSGTIRRSHGESELYYKEFDSPETNYGVSEDNDGEEMENAFAEAKFLGFALQGGLLNREKEVPTASYGSVFNSSKTVTWDRVRYLDLSYAGSAWELFDISARTYYQWYQYKGDYEYEYAEQDGESELVINKDFAEGQTAAGELRIDKEFGKHWVSIGGEYRNNLVQDQKNYDPDPFYSYLDDQRDSSEWGVYAQGVFRLHEKIRVNAGVRFDHYESFGGTTNPRLALIYKPQPNTALKLIYGTAFRAPSAYELYYQDGETQKSNPYLDSEEIRTYEAIIEHYFSKRFQLNLSAYHYDIDNLISLVIDGEDRLLVFKNAERVEAFGLEGEFALRLDSGIRSMLSYTYQDNEDKMFGWILTASPRHLGKWSVQLPLYEESVFAGIEVQYYGRQKTVVGGEVDDYLLTNMTLLSIELVKNLDLSASLYNVFDTTYYCPSSGEHSQEAIEQPGREFRIKATYRF